MTTRACCVLADRPWPSSMGISPNRSPRSISAITDSCPSTERVAMAMRPSSTTKSWSGSIALPEEDVASAQIDRSCRAATPRSQDSPWISANISVARSRSRSAIGGSLSTSPVTAVTVLLAFPGHAGRGFQSSAWRLRRWTPCLSVYRSARCPPGRLSSLPGSAAASAGAKQFEPLAGARVVDWALRAAVAGC